VFTKPLLRNGLHNAVVPPQLGADDIENTASPIVACWVMFTELLPGNMLIKSATICNLYFINYSHIFYGFFFGDFKRFSRVKLTTQFWVCASF
jgi:hypothetical protein